MNSNTTSRWAKTLPALGLALVMGTALTLSGCTQKTSVQSKQFAKTPVVKQTTSNLDFGYPSRPPSLKAGKEIFTKNCLSCHTPASFQSSKIQKDFIYTTPIDLYVLLSTGKAPVLKKETATRKQLKLSGQHPAFKATLTRDDRWDAIFYARHLAGASDITHAAKNDDPSVAAIYGANCAVCHGKKGNANGPLHTGHPSSHELKGGQVHGGLFYPAPARFTQYDRVFNRTDAQWYTYLVEGIYPSGMPAWLGNVDQDKQYTFNETLLWMLVKHVRQLSYNSDLAEGTVNPSGLATSAYGPTVNPLIPAVTTGTFKYKGDHKNDFFKENAGSRMPLLNDTSSTHEEVH